MNGKAPSGEFDVVVVGSGPAGVSACWPMLGAGMRVLMIDGGTTSTSQAPSADTLADLRTDERQAARWLLDPAAYETDVAATSPKLRTPVLRRWLKDYDQAYGIRTRNFMLNGVLAPGGLSNAWGGGACCFTEEELKGFPISRSELMPSYQAVAARIGISGSTDDDLGAWLGEEVAVQPPLPMHDGAQLLHDRYRARRAAVQRHGLRLGRARQAVLSGGHAGRKACQQSNLCLWGCAQSAIYNAAHDLTALVKEQGFTLWSGTFVSMVQRTETAGFILHLRDRDGEEVRQIPAPRVVLAAGTIGSTVLAFGSLGIRKVEVRLLTSPVMAFALFQPNRLGTVPARQGYGMAQLVFSLDIPMLPEGEALYGAIFASDGLPASELISRMPLSQPNAVAMARRIWPAMLLGSCFFPGELTNNRMVLEAGGNGIDVAVTGGITEQFGTALAQARRRIARSAVRMGAFLIPGSTSVAQPGADMHYCGTLPMRTHPQLMETDSFGRLGGASDLYVVDGSVLPRLPGKAHTLTIMANADRISRTIADRWRHDHQSR